jgi:hypothetical protein
MNRSTPCPKKYGSSLFFACTTIRTVETLHRSQTRARKRELVLVFEAAWMVYCLFFNSFSIRLLRDETHPKILFLSSIVNRLVRHFLKE